MGQKISCRLTGKAGGWAGPVAVLTMWTYCFMSTGVIKALGVMLPTLRDQFETKSWVIGWITSMVVAMSGFIGPFVGPLVRRFGASGVIMTCGAMLGLASIAGSFAIATYQLALAYTLLAGAGLGMSDVISKQVVGRCFDQNHATAIGIARTGASMGLFISAPVVQILLDAYGWRGTMLLMGAICSHMILCGALMHQYGSSKPRNEDYQEIQGVSDFSSAIHPANLLSSLCTIWKSFVVNLDLKLFLDIRFWLTAIIYCNSKFAIDMWKIYFVSSVVSRGFSLEDAAAFVAVGGVGSLVSKLAQGFIVDRGILPCWAVMAIGLGCGTVSFCTTPWLKSYWSIMLLSSLLLMTGYGLTICIDVAVKQMLGVDLLAGVYGWIGILTTILRCTLGFLPGLMYDYSGSYNAPFFFLGCMCMPSLFSVLVLRYKQLV
ncbi:monocarboxylate transporter 13-like [Patiria miniata]|uniref:Major facilitator superfamily (MFS) profile domain-containing protein n=1 Tax=Patiria miniata TaxID=46514 RepID=A0A914BMQ6_PATMI|nr:monocarboxylate transporter 13-like [Patiria miniata]